MLYWLYILGLGSMQDVFLHRWSLTTRQKLITGPAWTRLVIQYADTQQIDVHHYNRGAEQTGCKLYRANYRIICDGSGDEMKGRVMPDSVRKGRIHHVRSNNLSCGADFQYSQHDYHQLNTGTASYNASEWLSIWLTALPGPSRGEGLWCGI